MPGAARHRVGSSPPWPLPAPTLPCAPASTWHDDDAAAKPPRPPQCVRIQPPRRGSPSPKQLAPASALEPTCGPTFDQLRTRGVGNFDFFIKDTFIGERIPYHLYQATIRSRAFLRRSGNFLSFTQPQKIRAVWPFGPPLKSVLVPKQACERVRSMLSFSPPRNSRSRDLWKSYASKILWIFSQSVLAPVRGARRRRPPVSGAYRRRILAAPRRPRPLRAQCRR